MRRDSMAVVFLLKRFGPRRTPVAFHWWGGGQGPFGVAVGSLYGGGPDGHRRPVMETTMVVWWSLSVSALHGGGHKGRECICGGMFLLAWTSLAVGVVDGCGRPRRRRLAPVLFVV
jgi:hypothetical protein